MAAQRPWWTPSLPGPGPANDATRKKQIPFRNAPMVQINDDNFEDLDEARMGTVLDALARGESPKPGPQIARQTSCPEGGPSSLKKMAERNYDYRGQW